MSAAAESFDAIIIGSGQGGNPLAGALVAAGRKTALIERQDVGGTCINRGCTPTKTLVASARVPNTETLQPAAAGIEVDERGFIRSNDRVETSAPGVYVLGDVKGGPQFTHISYDDFRILKANLLDGGDRTVRDRPVPYTVFMDPQLGRVGMTESEAKKSGRKIQVARMPMAWVARALEVDESRGLMKAIVDAETEEILGATVLGMEGSEVMAVFQMAMMGRPKYTVLRDAVFAHPTLAELLNNLLFYFVDEK
jgi:pyruvate/2-oxoglutarate dehydrogenase complex dihydrolipoamide dehydrogenase (E3) component